MIKNKKKVSILVTTFNRADKVCKAIDSALAQTYKCEVVVVDHGSTDDTSKVIKKYGKKIKCVHKEEDFGPHFSWLDGALHCTGEFIHIQHDDDWIKPNFVEECMRLFKEDVGCVFSDTEIVDLKTKNSFIRHNLSKKYKTGIYPNKILEREVLKCDVISPSCCIYHKVDLIDALIQGKIPLKSNKVYHGVGADIFMMLLSIIRYKNFGYVNKSLACFGLHDGSITIDSQKDKAKTKRIKDAYDMVKVYYLGLKHIQKNLKIYETKLKIINSMNLKNILQLRFLTKPLETFIKKLLKKSK
jgi:glycosyltransferase involved in cell wall biosynthesis